MRERFRETVQSALTKLRALQQGKLTLRQLGDKVERLYYLSHSTNNPKEAETQKIVKFLSALNNPDIHRFVLLSKPVRLDDAVQHAIIYSAPEVARGQQGIAEAGVNAVQQQIDTKALVSQDELTKLRKELYKAMEARGDNKSSSNSSQTGSKKDKCANTVTKKKPRRPKSDARRCFFCQGTGHFIAQCRKLKRLKASQATLNSVEPGTTGVPALEQIQKKMQEKPSVVNESAIPPAVSTAGDVDIPRVDDTTGLSAVVVRNNTARDVASVTVCQNTCKAAQGVQEHGEATSEHEVGDSFAELSVAGLQKSDPGAVGTIYNCVRNGVVLSAAELQSSCSELCRLHSMLSLMEIGDNGTLFVKVSTRRGKLTKLVMVCPSIWRSRVTADMHQQSHQGYSHTLRKLKNIWFWPGMSSMVRREVKRCESCRESKKACTKDSTADGKQCRLSDCKDVEHPMPSTDDGTLFKVGDLVLVDSRQRKKGLNPKLQAQSVVPYQISKACCNHTYRLDGYQSLVSQSRLKLYHDVVVEQPVRASSPVVSSSARAERQSELSTHCGDSNPPTGNSNAKDKELSASADTSTAMDQQTTTENGKQQPTKKNSAKGEGTSKKTSSRTFVNKRLWKKKVASTKPTAKESVPVRRSTRKRSQPERLTC